MPATIVRPENFTLRAYQVGFGDCLLLTFHYPQLNTKAAFDRHILIDFGSSSPPKNASKSHFIRVAKDIADECKGKLDAVVVTHRHLDHISGFAPGTDGQGTGEIIAALKPDVVIQPWTEDPDAQKDALGPTTKQDPGFAQIRSLVNMNAFAGSVLEETRRLEGKLGARRLEQLEFLGRENLKNEAAVRNLMEMGKNRFYVYHGSRSGLETLLPGVKVHVLGPPTLKQSTGIRKQRAKDQEEFWQLQAAAGRRFVAGARPLFPGALVCKGERPPPFARWLIGRMLALRADQLLEIVRILDEQMNNTSVILLFETANGCLLFPGDAQIENWSYALKESPRSKDIRALLAATSLFKVGHHGSGNATPKTLWGLFQKRGSKAKTDRLQSVLSTKKGKHNGVPQEKLVAALESETACKTTEGVKVSDLKLVVGPIPL
jgi:hypothetical protein